MISRSDFETFYFDFELFLNDFLTFSYFLMRSVWRRYLELISVPFWFNFGSILDALGVDVAPFGDVLSTSFVIFSHMIFRSDFGRILNGF